MVEHTEASNHSITQSSAAQPEKVDINTNGAPVSKNAAKISSRVGKLVRSHVPISYESWDKVPSKYKDDIWDELLKEFEIESGAKDFFLKKMAESFRRYKSELRVKYYDKFDTDEDRLKNCPPCVRQEDWEGFLKNEAKPGASERRGIGKRNRSLYKYGHHTGRTSHAVVEHEMASANQAKEITRRQVWEKTHTKKDGTISDTASVYFDKIAKIKESINDSDEEALPLDEDILSQVFGKNKKGRTRSIGANISRTQVKASAIATKQLKRSHGDSHDLKFRMDNMEDTLKTLVDMFKGYISQGNCIPSNASNGGGNGTPRGSVGRVVNNDIANPVNSSSSSNQKCEILNFELQVIATATICRDSTACIIHGKPVPPTHEKLVVDNIMLPEEKTTSQNHPLATTFGEVGIGGFVCHPKNSIRYL